MSEGAVKRVLRESDSQFAMASEATDQERSRIYKVLNVIKRGLM